MEKSEVSRIRSARGRTVGSTDESLANLYDVHAAACLRLAYLLTGDSASAEDVVQEAFVRMHARFQNRRPPAALRAYLRKTIINVSKDGFRRKQRLRSLESRLEVRDANDPAPEIESRVVMRDRLRHLPHRQRAALVLRYYEDLSEVEAADALGCSVPALKQLARRGLDGLRRQEVEANRD